MVQKLSSKNQSLDQMRFVRVVTLPKRFDIDFVKESIAKSHAVPLESMTCSKTEQI